MSYCKEVLTQLIESCSTNLMEMNKHLKAEYRNDFHLNRPMATCRIDNNGGELFLVTVAATARED